MPYTYSYPRPALTVDCAVVGFDGRRLRILLIERRNEPFAGCWALPGGFVDHNEPLLQAAARELAEETGLQKVHLEQLATFGDPGRDPRGHTVSVVFLGMVRITEHSPRAADDACRAVWHSLGRPPALAFDHRNILRCVRRALARKARWGPFGCDLLPRVFSLDQLVALYRQALRHPIEGRKLKRYLSRIGLLVPAGRAPARGGREWPGPFSFDLRRYRRLERCGLPAPWLHR